MMNALYNALSASMCEFYMLYTSYYTLLFYASKDLRRSINNVTTTANTEAEQVHSDNQDSFPISQTLWLIYKKLITAIQSAISAIFQNTGPRK